MTLSNYTILFRLEVFHNYFENGLSHDLNFSPGPNTKSLMKRFGFYIDYFSNGFDVYANLRTSFEDLIAYIKQATETSFFDFELKVENDAFFLFTDLPDNEAKNIGFNSQNQSNTFTSSGLELTAMDGVQSEETMNSGLILYYDDILKLRTENDVAKFQISFHARSTQWQYYFINKSQINFKNFKVKGKTNVEFNGPTDVLLPNAENAFLFSSGDELITLSETPKHKFNLIDIVYGKSTNDNTIGHKPKTIISALPCPNIDETGFDYKSGNKIMTSPIYIYV